MSCGQKLTTWSGDAQADREQPHLGRRVSRGRGDDVMALPFDTTFSDYNLELMRAADTLVFGAVTFRGMVGYWPSVADDPAQSDVERAIAQRHRELEHLVVSDSLTMEEAGRLA